MTVLWRKLLDAVGREPAQILGLVAAGIALVSSLYLPLTIVQQGELNAVAVAVVGLLTALAVHSEGAMALFAGLIQALVSCALSFGLHLSPNVQGAVMALVAAGMALHVRTQVVAPIGPPLTLGRHSLAE